MNKTTNTTELTIDNFIFRIGASEYFMEAYIDVSYTYHPQEDGDRDTPTRYAYVTADKVTHVHSFEGRMQSYDAPTDLEIESVHYDTEKTNVWSDFFILNAQDRMLEQAQRILDVQLDDEELEEQQEAIESDNREYYTELHSQGMER